MSTSDSRKCKVSEWQRKSIFFL